MRRFFPVGFGVFLLLLASAVALLAVIFVRFFDQSYEVTPRNIALAVPAVLLAAVASASSLLQGLRLIGPQRFPFPRLRHLGAISGVSMLGTIGLFAGVVYTDARHAIHSELAITAVGKPVDLAFTAIDGRQVDLARMKGKVVLLDFWATWCGPCVAGIPEIQKLHDQWHARGFEVIGISLDGDKAALEKFVRDRNLPWPQYFDGLVWKNRVAQRFGIRAVPQLYLVDKQGRLRDIKGYDDHGQLAGKIAKLMAE